MEFIKIEGAREHNLKNVNVKIPKNKLVVISQVFWGLRIFNKSLLKVHRDKNAGVKGKEAFVIDPGESEPVERFIKSNQLDLRCIMITHHHFDHVGGVPELQKKFKNIDVFAKALWACKIQQWKLQKKGLAYFINK